MPRQKNADHRHRQARKQDRGKPRPAHRMASGVDLLADAGDHGAPRPGHRAPGSNAPSERRVSPARLRSRSTYAQPIASRFAHEDRPERPVKITKPLTVSVSRAASRLRSASPAAWARNARPAAAEIRTVPTSPFMPSTRFITWQNPTESISVSRAGSTDLSDVRVQGRHCPAPVFSDCTVSAPALMIEVPTGRIDR